MSSNNERKTPRFFIINPITDRRNETRFESRYEITVTIKSTKKSFTSVAYDIGQYGLKMEAPEPLEVGTAVEIAFPHSKENINCFGQVVWNRPMGGDRKQEIGVMISDWHGIVAGRNSWIQFKGIKLKQDRRRKAR